MTIPSRIFTLVNQIEQELDDIEQNAIMSVNTVRALLTRFPDNSALVRLFAILNNALFFVEMYRIRVLTTVDSIRVSEQTKEIQEVGEDLSTMLGTILEVKIDVSKITDELRNFE